MLGVGLARTCREAVRERAATSRPAASMANEMKGVGRRKGREEKVCETSDNVSPPWTPPFMLWQGSCKITQGYP